VRIEFVSQGCPRPLTWIWFEDDQKVGVPGASSKLGADATEEAEVEELVILFLHGGGYWAFTGRLHLEYVARIVREMGHVNLRVKACLVDTRRAPEHPWPAPLEDAMACYDWLQRAANYKASQIVLAGDSAGGGLALAMLLALRDERKPLPLCAVVVSPFIDLSRTLSQYPGVEALRTDFLIPHSATASASYYVQGADPKNPLVSPKYGELHGLPPILIQAGQGELLGKDSEEIARRLEAYGGRVKLEMYPEMPHVFPMFAPLFLEDAYTAVARQAKFVERRATGKEMAHTGRRLRVLVNTGRRTQSFQDVRFSSSDADCGDEDFTHLGHLSPSSPNAASSPALASLNGRRGRRDISRRDSCSLSCKAG
jgi:acetyl esterase/lipase